MTFEEVILPDGWTVTWPGAGIARVCNSEGWVLHVAPESKSSVGRLLAFVGGYLGHAAPPICPTESQQVAQKRSEFLDRARQRDPTIPCDARVVGGEALGGDLFVGMQIIIDGKAYQPPPGTAVSGMRIPLLNKLLPEGWKAQRIDDFSTRFHLPGGGDDMQMTFNAGVPGECEAKGVAFAWKKHYEMSEDRTWDGVGKVPSLKDISKVELLEAYKKLKRDVIQKKAEEERRHWEKGAPGHWETTGVPGARWRWVHSDHQPAYDPSRKGVVGASELHGATGHGFREGDVLEMHGPNGAEVVEVLDAGGALGGTLTVRKRDEVQASGPLTFGDGKGSPELEIGDVPEEKSGITIFDKEASPRWGEYNPPKDWFTFKAAEEPRLVTDLRKSDADDNAAPPPNVQNATCPHCEDGWHNMLIFRKKCTHCDGTGVLK
jgi:hypothetical protein